jgi:hypothetical protein
MRRTSQLATSHPMILVALLGVSALAAGCGSTSQAGPAAQGKDSTPQASSTVSQTATASGQPTGGQVTLTLDKQRYGARDAVVVTITNGLSRTIWAADHQTGCTVLVAEHAQASAWVPVGNCRLMTPTRLTPLSAGNTTVHLDTSAWPAGNYRITLNYNAGDEGVGGPGGIVHSAEFTVG